MVIIIRREQAAVEHHHVQPLGLMPGASRYILPARIRPAKSAWQRGGSAG